MTDLSTNAANAPVRVLQVASGDLWAGAEVQFFLLCEQLKSNKQVALDVVLLNDGELANRLRAIRIPVTIIDEAHLSFWQISMRFIGHCKGTKPDIIHSHRQKENVLAGLARLFLQIPSIRTVHGASECSYPLYSPKGIIARIDTLIGRYLQHCVVAVSEDLAQQLLVQYPAKHLDVVRNGLPKEASEDEPVALEEKYRHIGIVGRLVDVKRVDIFLHMAAELAVSEGETNYRFWVVGDGPLRPQHEALARQLGVNHLVTFAGHAQSARPYLKSLDILVMCSDHEGTPMTLLEAWQCHLPIVAHDVGGLRELLDGGACGHLVAEHNGTGYAKAVASILGDESLRAQYVQRGITRLKQHYSAESNAESYLNLYLKALGR